jgi:hypothetical protein
MMKNFFEAIAFLFEEILFIPLNILRELELNNWWMANAFSWLFVLIGFVALIYWVRQLQLFNQLGEENKDPSAHSFL